MSLVKETFLLLLAIFGAFGGISITHKYLLKKIKLKLRKRKFFGSPEENFIAVGSTLKGGVTRDSDQKVLTHLRDNTPKTIIPNSFYRPDKNENLIALKTSSHLLLIGSPRHNRLVDELQRITEMPFQFISYTPDAIAEKTILIIQEGTGQQHICSFDPNLGEFEQDSLPQFSEEEYDYGIVLVGDTEVKVGTPKRIIWIGGIHGIGTIGAAKWLVGNLKEYDWETLGNVCFLIRVDFKPTFGNVTDVDKKHENIEIAEPVLIRGPLKWKFKSPSNKPICILCDMGSVLLSYNRNQFDYNLKDFFNITINEQEKSSIEALRNDFEAGIIPGEDFIINLREILKQSPDDDELIKAAWCDIFWREEHVISFFKKLITENNRIKLALISNTDPWRLEYALKTLKLNTFFSPDKIIASFDDNVNPKGVDDSMLFRGLEVFKKEMKQQDFDVIYIDDIRHYTRMAGKKGLGIKGVHYRSLPQLIFDLRKYGLYLPINEIEK